jgi:hypothetical protein
MALKCRWLAVMDATLMSLVPLIELSQMKDNQTHLRSLIFV